MNLTNFSLWWLPALNGASGVLLLAALAAAYAAEASLLAFPAARVHGAIAKGERRARLLLPWIQQPQRTWFALVVLQSSCWTALLVLVLSVAGGEADLLAQGATSAQQAWQLVPLLAVLAGTVGLTAGCRLLGQFVGRSFATLVATQALWVLTPLGAVLGPLLQLLCRIVAPLGLGPVVRPGPWQMQRAGGESPLVCGPFWTAEAVAEVTHAAHHENMGERGPDLFASLATFSDTIIREVMVPRTDVLSLSLSASQDEVRAAMRNTEHSRMPVYDDTIDHIVGLLHVKALLVAPLAHEQPAGAFDLKALLRPTFYVPEVMKISALLREFQRRKTHMAIVVDEYGGTSGIVTLEDIIEEIVGEIHDEYDVEDKQFRMLADNKILADAKASIWDLEQALGVTFFAEGEFETLGGFLLALTGSLPARGVVVNYQDVRFTIKEANERRIRTVEIERRSRAEQ